MDISEVEFLISEEIGPIKKELSFLYSQTQDIDDNVDKIIYRLKELENKIDNINHLLSNLSK